MIDSSRIFAITRPHPKLMTLYVLRSILSGPGIILALPILYFRYHTMKYRFDEEGIGMSWGILFRREVNLTYSRIQDIHLTSGPIQRFFGLCDIQIQTASGSATAEMTIEGLLEFEIVRDFLYTRMRGYRDAHGSPPAVVESAEGSGPNEMAEALRAISADIRAARLAMERMGSQP